MNNDFYKQLDDLTTRLDKLERYSGSSGSFPVGAIFISTVSTNPATLLGFGTWTAFGAGKTLVGLDSGDTDFDTVEETGGSKTHTLTTAELAVHTHTQNSHRHWYSASSVDDGNMTGTGANGQEYGSYADAGTYSANDPGKSAGTNVAYATATNQNAGSGTPHSIVQPYVVTFMWKRTA